MTLKVIHRLQAFADAIRRTFVQHFTRCQLTVCSQGSPPLAELLVHTPPVSNVPVVDYCRNAQRRLV